MKKITFVITIFSVLFLLCSCTKPYQRNSETSDKSENAVIQTVISRTDKKTDSYYGDRQSVSENFGNSENNTDKEKSTEATSWLKDYIHGEEPPPLTWFTLEQLREFKLACETMNDEDFEKYLDNAKNLQQTSITDLESALTVLEAIENTTIILLDGDIANFMELDYHDVSGYLSQPIVLSDTRNLVCTYYTSLSDSNIYKTEKDFPNMEYIGQVNSNGITADIFISPNGSVEEFYAEIYTDSTRITYRVTEEQTLDEFKTDFSRLSFVKIGDLIEQGDAE